MSVSWGQLQAGGCVVKLIVDEFSSGVTATEHEGVL